MTKKSDTAKLKQEIKSEDKDADPALFARDRLTGALQELLHSDHSSDSDEFKTKLLSQKSEKYRSALLKKKRISKAHFSKSTGKGQSFQHTFVMKLFDRSVDLAQFDETTPLYPICRAWIANKPRVPAEERELTKKFKKEDKSNKNKKGTEDDTNKKEIYSLPLPTPLASDLSRIPPPVIRQEEELFLEPDKPFMNKQILLSSHLFHWAEVKKTFRAASYNNEQRYNGSEKILRRIYNNAQKSYTT